MKSASFSAHTIHCRPHNHQSFFIAGVLNLLHKQSFSF